MFVIELTYKAGLAEIDAHMAAHVTFLKKYYASGNFLVSGRKIPRDGGIILAVARSRRQIETIIEQDPFFENGLADFRIIEFRAANARTTFRNGSKGTDRRTVQPTALFPLGNRSPRTEAPCPG